MNADKEDTAACMMTRIHIYTVEDDADHFDEQLDGTPLHPIASLIRPIDGAQTHSTDIGPGSIQLETMSGTYIVCGYRYVCTCMPEYSEYVLLCLWGE